MRLVKINTNRILRLFGGLMRIPLHLVYGLSYYIPRNSKKWIYSAWEGKRYRGNCRFFFEYVSQNEAIESIWITKNRELYGSLKDSINIKYAYSIQGIYDLLTARVIITSHGLYDVIPYLTRGVLMVSLGHVTYPIKKMSFKKIFSEISFLHRLQAFLLTPYDHINPAYEIVTSDNAKKTTMFLREEQFDESTRIIPLGLPKSDYLIGIKEKCKMRLFKGIFQRSFPEICSRDKIILFLPTWRADKGFNLIDHGYNRSQLYNMLFENGAFMFMNHHPLDEHLRNIEVEKLGKRTFAVSYSSDEITQLLCAADIFITDYSSLYSDFLLFDKPIIFAKFSHDEYVEERELQVDYESLPGDIVSNWDEMTSAISIRLSKGEDQYKSERESWRKFIYSGADDGKSCERIYKFIENRI